jgi:hypothetical protein
MIFEWQLWMHPYPTMIKSKGRRLDPKRFPVGRIFQDGNEYVRVADLFEARKPTSPQLKRCVLAIAKKGIKNGMEPRAAISKGFAICTRQLQKHGYLKSGTNRPTEMGGSTGRSKAADKTHKSKVAEYGRLLAMARSE